MFKLKYFVSLPKEQKDITFPNKSLLKCKKKYLAVMAESILASIISNTKPANMKLNMS